MLGFIGLTAACSGHERPLRVVGFLEVPPAEKASYRMRHKISQDNDSKHQWSYKGEYLPTKIHELPKYVQRKSQKREQHHLIASIGKKTGWCQVSDMCLAVQI